MKNIFLICAVLALILLYAISHDTLAREVSASAKSVVVKINKSLKRGRQPLVLKKQSQAKPLETKPRDNQIAASGPPPSVCANADVSNFECYANYYRDLLAKKGVKAAFDDLRLRYNYNPYVQSQCHPLTHVIGNAAAKKFETVSDAFLVGDSFCWSGYYHGIMEGIVNKIGYANLQAQINNICAPLAAKRKFSFDHYNCVHGLGHGVMAITEDELFDSLKLCDYLNEGWDRSSCWSGVFMENIIFDEKNHFSKYLKTNDPLYPCDAVDDGYKNTCYLMQTSHMLKAMGGDFAKVFALCSQAETPYQNTCYQSLGRDASGRSVSDIQRTKAYCDLGKDFRQKSNCVIGAVKDFISYHHSDEQAKSLCFSLDQSLQDICYSTVESFYKTF